MAELNIKIGSRILSDTEAAVLLPSYELIYRQIDDFAQTATESLKKPDEKGDKLTQDILKKDREFSKHHNNVFSILGARGTGKTSVLLTIKFRIENNNNDKKLNNIIPVVLPTIVPDDMEQSGDIIGWILGSFESIVDEHNTEYVIKMKKENPHDCARAYESAISKTFKKVLKYYQFRKDSYYSVIKEQYMGKLEFIDETTNMLVADRKLVSAFDEFINELVETTRKKYEDISKDGNEKKQPMLFIFFDDVDLSNDKCPDVFNTILRYLSNKNIIVFVGGDYNQFVENLTMNYLKTDNLLTNKLMRVDYISPDKYIETEEICTVDESTENKQLFYDNKSYAVNPTIKSSTDKKVEKAKNSALEVRKKLSASFIKKVLSPATRYELQYLNNDQKANFSYDINEKKLPTLQELINNRLNFNITEERYKIYLQVFDKTPRGLINIYYYLYATMGKTEITVDELRHFLSLLVNSNDELIDYKSEIERSVTFIKNEISIDYRYNIEAKSANSLFIILLLKFFADIAKKNKLVIKQEFSFNKFKAFLWARFTDRFLIFPNDGFVESFYMELLNAISPNNYILADRLNNDQQSDDYPIAQFIGLVHDIATKEEYSNSQTLIDSFNWAYEKNSQWVIYMFSRLVILFPFSNDFLIKSPQSYITDFETIFKNNFNFDLSEFNKLQASYKQIKGKRKQNIIQMVKSQKDLTKKAIKELKVLREELLKDATGMNTAPQNIADLLEMLNNLYQENQDFVQSRESLKHIVVSRIKQIDNILKQISSENNKLHTDFEGFIEVKRLNAIVRELIIIQNELRDIPIEIIKTVEDFEDFGIARVNIERYHAEADIVKDFHIDETINNYKTAIDTLKDCAKKQKNICEKIINDCENDIKEHNIDKYHDNLFKAYIKSKNFDRHNCAAIYMTEFNQIKGRLDKLYSWSASALPNELENLRTVSKYLLKTYLTYIIEIKCNSLENILSEFENEKSIESISIKNQAYGLRFKLLEEILSLNDDKDNAFVKWFKSETYTGQDN